MKLWELRMWQKNWKSRSLSGSGISPSTSTARDSLSLSPWFVSLFTLSIHPIISLFLSPSALSQSNSIRCDPILGDESSWHDDFFLFFSFWITSRRGFSRLEWLGWVEWVGFMEWVNGWWFMQRVQGRQAGGKGGGKGDFQLSTPDWFRSELLYIRVSSDERTNERTNKVFMMMALGWMDGYTASPPPPSLPVTQTTPHTYLPTYQTNNNQIGRYMIYSCYLVLPNPPLSLSSSHRITNEWMNRLYLYLPYQYPSSLTHH